MKLFQFLWLIFMCRMSLAKIKASVISQIIPDFVRDVITDGETIYRPTQDIAAFQFDDNSKSKKLIDDIFCEILKSIGSSIPIIMPLTSKELSSLSLRKVSYIIIVTDLYSAVNIFDEIFLRIDYQAYLMSTAINSRCSFDSSRLSILE